MDIFVETQCFCTDLVLFYIQHCLGGLQGLNGNPRCLPYPSVNPRCIRPGSEKTQEQTGFRAALSSSYRYRYKITACTYRIKVYRQEFSLEMGKLQCTSRNSDGHW